MTAAAAPLPPATDNFPPSLQQQAVYDWIEEQQGSANVEAVAGSGKTTMLIEAVGKMTLQAPMAQIAFTAYNKKIAVEIEQRLKAKGAGNNVRAGTFHSFGFGAVRKLAPRVKVEEKKTQLLIERARPKIDESLHGFVRQLVSLAKQRAIGVLTSFEDHAAWLDIVEHFDLDEELAEDNGNAIDVDAIVQEGIAHAKRILQESITSAEEMVDFDDMIYVPLARNLRLWQYDWVLIDEAQDTNPARRALAKKMLRPGGRLIAVGDRHQAIYGFTGADSDSLDLIAREFGCIELPLTVTYRCPKAVVAHAQQWVSHIHAAPEAPEGIVRELPEGDFLKLGADALTRRDAVLCRNTKPLVTLAYGLIRKGIPCHVEGRDIGRGLLALAGKWKVTRLDALLDRLESFLAKETQRLLAKGQEQKAESLADKVETLRVIADTLPDGATVNDLRAAIERLFGDVEPGQASPNLTLSTVHKSKGREWDRVYLYGRNKYMPSKYARQAWQFQQEVNLMYVAATRAKRELIEVTL